MEKVAVFCGSRDGTDSLYKEKAYQLGELLAEQKITLVYGGASVGLMGAVADGAIERKGKVIGVLPKILSDREVAHQGLTDLKIVNTMHERKALMYEQSDGFIVLPGGIGTLEEFFEVLTWNAIGEHTKPCGLLNVNGYYDPVIALLDHMVDQQFLHTKIRDFVFVEEDEEALITKMKNKEHN